MSERVSLAQRLIPWFAALVPGVACLLAAGGAHAQIRQLQPLPPVDLSIPPAAQVGLQMEESLPPPAADAAASPGSAEPSGAIVPRVPESVLPPPAEPAAAWYRPQYWLPAPVWSGSIELGINGSSGNSETLSTKSGFKLNRKTEYHLWKANLNYVRTEASAVETQHNALLKADYERLFTDSPWSLYTNFGAEYDEFKPFDLRASVNGGVSYAWFNDDITKLKYRFGAGASQEIGGVVDDVIPEAAFGLDLERKLTQRQSFAGTLDYYPNWTEFGDYRMVTDIGWQVLLDEASNLSMKLGVINRYDSTPNGSQPNDINYSLLLLWKL